MLTMCGQTGLGGECSLYAKSGKSAVYWTNNYKKNMTIIWADII